jgi:hypothetical protein
VIARAGQARELGWRTTTDADTMRLAMTEGAMVTKYRAKRLGACTP